MQSENSQSKATKAPEIQELEGIVKLLMVRHAWSIVGLLDQKATVSTTTIITLPPNH